MFSHLVWRQRLQRGDDVALLRHLPLILPKQILHGALRCHGCGIVINAQVRSGVHGQISILRLFFHASILQHHAGVHLHHPLVQNTVDPGQFCVLGFAELQRTHQGVFQPHLGQKVNYRKWFNHRTQ